MVQNTMPACWGSIGCSTIAIAAIAGIVFSTGGITVGSLGLAGILGAKWICVYSIISFVNPLFLLLGILGLNGIVSASVISGTLLIFSIINFTSFVLVFSICTTSAFSAGAIGCNDECCL